jgi:hypothetical protein
VGSAVKAAVTLYASNTHADAIKIDRVTLARSFAGI